MIGDQAQTSIDLSSYPPFLFILSEVAGLFAEPDLRTMALIEPSVRFLFNESLNCFKRKEKMIKLLGKELGNAEYNRTNNCDRINKTLQFSTNKIDSYVCLCKVYDPNVMYYLQMYNMFKQGVMPFEGGYLDQPAIIISILDEVGRVVEELKQEEEAKASKKRGRK